MPLQNRADPFGVLHAVASRGGMMGNRGGKFHRPDQSLGKRQYASRRWICCVCEFRGRQRQVWGEGYTEIFFLDEVTALAGGHRPCFECRRADAKDFANRFPRSGQVIPNADAMDAVLHGQRMALRGGERPKLAANALPDGAMIAIEGKPYAVKSGRLLAWSFQGYADSATAGRAPVDVLTPLAIVETLRNGYAPRWHT
ncbi:MAG: hypothetical protein AB7F96_18415 [Beijerinckiaceae bacterium]